MKRFYLYSFLLMAVTCASCYEGEDLVQIHESYGEQQSLLSKVADLTQTSAKIKVQVVNPRYDSQLVIYYSDQPDADLLTSGEQKEYPDTYQDLLGEVEFSLNNLMPDTQYRYVAAYTDAGGKRMLTEEASFQTYGFNMSCYAYIKTYFTCDIHVQYNNLLPGAEPGFVYGEDPEPTIENAPKNVVVDYKLGSSAGLNKSFSGFEPDKQFFFRPYIKYFGRIYYGEIESTKMPKIEIRFYTPFHTIVNNKTVRIITLIRHLNVKNGYELPGMPEMSYGVTVSTQAGATFDEAKRFYATVNGDGRINVEFKDAIPGVVYYAKAFVKWRDQIFFSNEISFSLPQ